MIKEMLNNCAEKLGSKKKALLLLFLCIVGVALILLGNVSSDEKSKNNASSDYTGFEEKYNKDYVDALKEEIVQIISQIDGVGAVSVAVTLEYGVSFEYAREKSYTDDSGEDDSYKKSGEERLIVLEGENGEEPVLLRRTEPVVLGVAVVCEGGGDKLIVEKVTETISVLCGIRSNRVSVSKMT